MQISLNGCDLPASLLRVRIHDLVLGRQRVSGTQALRTPKAELRRKSVQGNQAVLWCAACGIMWEKWGGGRAPGRRHAAAQAPPCAPNTPPESPSQEYLQAPQLRPREQLQIIDTIKPFQLLSFEKAFLLALQRDQRQERRQAPRLPCLQL